MKVDGGKKKREIENLTENNLSEYVHVYCFYKYNFNT
jgi:hypothetical protein